MKISTAADDQPGQSEPAAQAQQFKEHSAITKNKLRQLVERHYQHPVISLYIDLSPDRLLRERKVYVTVFNSLKHTATITHRQFLNTLSHQDRLSIREGMVHIHAYLAHQFDAANARSLAIFYAKQELQEVYALSSPGRDYLAIDSDPYTLPMEAILDVEQNLLIARLDQNQADIYQYRTGQLQVLDTITADRPDSIDISMDKSRPNKVQRHEQDMLHQFLKKVTDRLAALSHQTAITKIVLSGDRRIMSHFEHHELPQHFRQNLLAILPYSPHQSEAEMLNQIRQAIECQQVKEEGYYLDMLHHEDGRDSLIKGLDQVLSAQNRFLVRSLVVDEDFKKPGFYCRQDMYLATHAGNCPICNKPLAAIDNVVDKLIELARQYHMDYKVLHAHKTDLDEYGGIAAAIYRLHTL